MSEMQYITTAIGFCDLCGESLTGQGIDTGPVTMIGWDCALKVAAIVSAVLAGGSVPQADPEEDTEERSAALRKRRRAAVAA